MSENMVGTKQAAEILGVSISTIYRMVDQGILQPSKTPGGQRRFSVNQLEDYKEKSRGIVAPQNPYQMKLDVVSGENVENTGDSHSETTYANECGSETTTDPVVDDKSVDSRNLLNDLNGSQWLLETKSFFYQKGLGAKHPHAQIERQHPAPFSFQDISHLVTFFTKEGMKVLDPFGGVGSTAKACELEGRICTSIELQKKWHNLAIVRLETEVGEGSSKKHSFILGDTREELKKLDDCSFDFMVTSPPYWSILNKKADYKVKKDEQHYAS